MNCEDSKYENIIKKYTDRQLIFEASIVNKQYKTIYSQKKAIEEEMDRRLKETEEK